METSAEIKDIAAALTKAQAEIKNVVKNTDNSYFKSRYADLSAILDASRDPLSKNGLSVMQTPEDNGGGGVSLRTTILHSSGQFITSVYTLPPTKQDPQGYGSAITYMRRYALSAVLGIGQEDDDGNLASGRNQNSQAKAQPPAVDKAKEHAADFANNMKTQIAEASSIESLNALVLNNAELLTRLQTGYAELFNKVESEWWGRVRALAATEMQAAE